MSPISPQKLLALQILATRCHQFRKIDVSNAIAMAGLQKSATPKFVDSLLLYGVIVKDFRYGGGANFVFTPKLWLECLRSIEPKRFKFVASVGAKLGVNCFYNEPHFAEAVHAFLNGQPFQELLEQAVPNYRFGYKECYVNRLLHELTDEKELRPLYYELNEKLLEDTLLEEASKVQTLEFTQKDLDFLADVEKHNTHISDTVSKQLRWLVYFYRDVVLGGRLEEPSLDREMSDELLRFQGAISCIQQGNYDQAFKLFRDALKKNAISKYYFQQDLLNFYYAIALVNSTLATARSKIETLLKQDLLDMAWTSSMGVILLVETGRKKMIAPVDLKSADCSFITKILVMLVCKHYNIKMNVNEDALLDQLDETGALLLQAELSDDFARYADRKKELAERTGMHPSLRPFKERPEWELVLDELMLINKAKETTAASAKSASTQRIVYKVSVTSFTVQPILQKSKNGITWTAGRNIALSRFRKNDVEEMTTQDKAVAACVSEWDDHWGDYTDLNLSGPKVMAALAGHPLVFDAQTMKRLDVVLENPVLTVSLEKNAYVVRCDIDPERVIEGHHAFLDNGGRIKVTKVTPKLKATIKGLMGLKFPVEAKDRLASLLSVLSGEMIIMSDLLKSQENVDTRSAHPETVVQLKPCGTDIHCNLVVKPFGDMPPLCRPGKGMQTVTAMADGAHVQTTRNLKEEKANYERVSELMVNYEYDARTEIWTLAPEECLELLDSLRAMPSQCVIEWPEGERFKVSYGQLTPSAFKLSLGKAANWFELTGEVEISDKVKMKMAELMERLSQSRGNFIQVGEKEYVRIAADLRRHIETLSRIASMERGKLRISTFNTPQLETLEQSGVSLTTDSAYKNLLDRMEQARTAQVRIPKTVNADLRSYQKEGYQWMSRLSLWGAGALLADDMGLGKTLQAIALLVSRAKEGAQLVVVPTSLTLNWMSEMGRFAPGLNALLLNKPGGDRKSQIDGAKAYDVVITTYGLLITEEELLTSRQWTTVVLDEAHTIKNRDTKMSKAAMGLKADARLLLTGTPLQNHVSELWNLMQFANPGLLGTFQEFTDRFILPIERDHDKEQQRMLKRIISPFILRRTKTDVLNELPEKTEITLRVDLSEEEWAFYDNIRQRALTSLEAGEATAMQALAEITRLRQAACNASLVEKSAHIKSSKLESFMQLVQELHANHHRALVFSQFTSHLALVRQRLDEEGINYLYLDGATPAKERQRLTEEFQHGDAPLFLISLKAGGLGLNLTAANYVVHLDPWWNPAIEDQASDRAHRIGQKNSVTVYRIIAAGTIEEKILTLHQTKKNMADALLEGGDVSASMTREEMMELIKECR